MTALRHAEITRLCNELRDPRTCDFSHEQRTILQLLHAFDTYEALARDESAEPARAELHRTLAHMPRQCGKTFVQALFLTACVVSAPVECSTCFLFASQKAASDTLALARAFLDKEASGVAVQPGAEGDDLVVFVDREERLKSVCCYWFSDEHEARAARSLYSMWLMDVGTTKASASLESAL